MATVPDVGSSRPAIRRRVVVLPQPDGPTRTSNSFSSTVRLALSTARMLSPWGPEKSFVRFSMTTRAMKSFLELGGKKSSPSRPSQLVSLMDTRQVPALAHIIHRQKHEPGRIVF